MSQLSRRQLPPYELPFLEKDGKVNIEWYAYLRWHDQEHGGDRTDVLVRTLATTVTASAPSLIAGAAGTIPLVIDGTTYNVVIE